MKVNEDKNIEKLVAKMMNEIPLEKPSFDFTSKVMAQVLANKTNDITTYKPLISKPLLILIFGSFFILFGYCIINGNTESSNEWFDSINLSQYYNNRLFLGLKFSKITAYAVLLSTLMLFLQIPLLKNHFDRQLEQ